MDEAAFQRLTFLVSWFEDMHLCFLENFEFKLWPFLVRCLRSLIVWLELKVTTFVCSFACFCCGQNLDFRESNELYLYYKYMKKLGPFLIHNYGIAECLVILAVSWLIVLSYYKWKCNSRRSYRLIPMAKDSVFYLLESGVSHPEFFF